MAQQSPLQAWPHGTGLFAQIAGEAGAAAPTAFVTGLNGPAAHLVAHQPGAAGGYVYPEHAHVTKVTHQQRQLKLRIVPTGLPWPPVSLTLLLHPLSLRCSHQAASVTRCSSVVCSLATRQLERGMRQ